MPLDKIVILVFVGSYIPGFKGGGPIRSIANLVELLGDEFDFKIVTYDHDHGVSEPYIGIASDTWVTVGKAEVYYASKSSLRLFAMVRLVNSIEYDVIYLNSVFSPNFSIKPLLIRRLGLISNVYTVMAPRGEFSQGALMLKKLKKQLYITFAHFFGLYRNILWQASSKFEAADIQKTVANSFSKAIVVAPNLAHHPNDVSSATNCVKKTGELSIAFLSRISPKKNLDGALSMLKGMQGDITFNIYGPPEDQAYLQKCQNICKSFNVNIKVHFHGAVDHSRVQEIFTSNHLFFFPTHGENFGHVILEALLAGCPVLLSDQTPWRNLVSHRIGWDLPLNCPDEFRAALMLCLDMDNEEFAAISQCAKSYGRSRSKDPLALENNRDLFLSAYKKCKLNVKINLQKEA